MTPEIQAGKLCAEFAGTLLGPWSQREEKGERGAMALIFATASLFCGNRPELAFEDVALVATAHMFGLKAEPAQELTAQFGSVLWNGLPEKSKDLLVDAVDRWARTRSDPYRDLVHAALNDVVSHLESVGVTRQ